MDKNNYNEQSRDRLLRIISKKLLTVGISALSAFETHILGNPKFSDLAGELEKEYESFVRKIVLDAVNKQARNVESELKMYECVWQKYNIKFDVKRMGE